jgi:hypothetical protein
MCGDNPDPNAQEETPQATSPIVHADIYNGHIHTYTITGCPIFHADIRIRCAGTDAGAYCDAITCAASFVAAIQRDAPAAAEAG